MAKIQEMVSLIRKHTKRGCSTGETAAAVMKDNTSWSQELATRREAQAGSKELKDGPMLLNGSSSAETVGDQDGLGAAPTALSFDGAIAPPASTTYLIKQEPGNRANSSHHEMHKNK